jgi:hypothetical protein
MFLETSGQPIRFPSKAEEPKQRTTEVSKQMALSSGPELCGCCTGICLFPCPAIVANMAAQVNFVLEGKDVVCPISC